MYRLGLRRLHAMNLEINLGSRSRTGSGRSKTGLVFGILFALPFSGLGLFFAVVGVREMIRGNWKAGPFITLFGLVFAAIGFGLMYAIVRARKQAAREEQTRAQNPDSPWLWREDWARGRITSSSKGAMIGAWIFAGFWNLVSWPVVFALPKELAKGNHAIWIGLIFPAVGICLLVWAIRATIRWRKFGESVFEMASVPGVIGGALTGTIRPGQGLRLMQEFRIKISSVHRYTTGSGKNRSTHENVLWQDERKVSSDFNGLIPISIAIPADSRESEGNDANNCILWRLEATADVPGVDYAAQFEVPVFRVALTPEQAAAAAAAQSQRQAALAAYQRPANSPIRVRPALHGGTEFLFPPCRNPGAALGLTVFTMIWTASIAFMVWKKAPIFFPIVFGLFELLLLYALFQMWFGVTHVLIRSGRIEISRRALGFGHANTVTADEISEIRTSPGMTAGKTVYHDIQVHCHNGRKLAAGDAIKDRMEAEWLAAEMRKLVGMEAN
jgi:hypothetical protein